jgi:hypothetical protein
MSGDLSALRARCVHDDRWTKLTWPSGQASSLVFAVPLGGISAMGVVGWTNTFAAGTAWSEVGVVSGIGLGIVAALGALVVMAFVALTATLIVRFATLPRKLLVDRDQIVPIGPLGIRYPWQRVQLPVETLIEPRRRQSGVHNYSIVVRRRGRPVNLAWFAQRSDAHFIATHLRSP